MQSLEPKVFFAGTFLSLEATIVVDLVGMEHAAIGQGWFHSTVGIAVLPSLPFTGIWT